MIQGTSLSLRILLVKMVLLHRPLGFMNTKKIIWYNNTKKIISSVWYSIFFYKIDVPSRVATKSLSPPLLLVISNFPSWLHFQVYMEEKGYVIPITWHHSKLVEICRDGAQECKASQVTLIFTSGWELLFHLESTPCLVPTTALTPSGLTCL